MTSAVRRPRPPQPLEKRIQAAIRDYLTLHGWRVHRLTADVRPDAPRVNEADKEEPGTPDLIAVRLSPAAAVYIEVKRPKEDLRPSQKIWHADAKRRGWTVVVAAGIEDVEWMTR